jgi:hypothetical protein
MVFLSTALKCICVGAVFVVTPDVCSIILEVIVLRASKHRTAAFFTSACVQVVVKIAGCIFALDLFGTVLSYIACWWRICVARSHRLAAAIAILI